MGSFASILEDLSPLDATLLETIYAFPYDDAEGDGIWTDGLPDSVSVEIREEEPAPSEDVQVSLGNLSSNICFEISQPISSELSSMSISVSRYFPLSSEA